MLGDGHSSSATADSTTEGHTQAQEPDESKYRWQGLPQAGGVVLGDLLQAKGPGWFSKYACAGYVDVCMCRA